MKSCSESSPIMAIKANKYGKYPVQICLTRKEYDALRKEAYKVDMTLNKFILKVVQEYVQRK